VDELSRDEPTQPVAVIAGWYGKLPSLGDFANRRLPTAFIDTWDGWLQGVLQATQDAIGPSWLDSYLTTPIWRFALLPGLLGVSGWAGVLMPSVDRVGRYFPLSVIVELPSYAAVARAVFKGGDWFAGLEDATLGMLDSGRGPADLDETLATLPLSLPAAEDVDDSADSPRPLSSIEGFESVAGGRALAAWAQHKGWRALWWTRGRVDGQPLIFTCTGLPTAEEFGKLLESGRPSAPAILGS
jgi:type VI secretion system protein ImpM